MKKAIIALGFITMMTNSVSASTIKRNNDAIAITIGLLASAILIATLISSSEKDLPVSP